MSGWLSTALQNVREKSLDALDFVKRDLAEFTTTVKSDTETYLHKIKAPEVSNVSLDRLLPKWNSPTTSNEGLQLHSSASFDRFQNELKRIQNDESTYLNDPNPFEPYQTWRETNEFNIETRKGEVSQLLIDAPHVRAFYARLVPAETSHVEFWARYYYRVHQLEEDEARRTKLIQRAHEICEKKNDDQDLNQGNDWDEPDDQWSEELPNTTPSAISVESKTSEDVSQSVVEEKPVMQIESENTKENDEGRPSINEFAPVEQQADVRLGSGDSWEHEFDENDLSSTKPDSKNEETQPILTTDISTNEKKSSAELDDDWEAWS